MTGDRSHSRGALFPNLGERDRRVFELLVWNAAMAVSDLPASHPGRIKTGAIREQVHPLLTRAQAHDRPFAGAQF
ncbi:hypothetical protein [Jiella marina]|uniref:hypothetical protein n=1 Tax=Jiella sp. LLJ827 TaxID=2917712 RepID=UPI002101301E|nr:hypothetical protein [Jiella sp. LLJ827]MCQ0988162.1 hypothetical protein [Jiella sp. LLJ827]